MSARDSWFRRKSWSKAGAAEFERRLSKSRGQREQYLRLQALHLAETRKPKLAVPAIALANRCLEEDPDGFYQVEVYLTIAAANETLDNATEAIKAYRAAVRAEAKRRGPRCCAYLYYAWYAAINGFTDEFDRVLRAMKSAEDEDLVFPIAQYKYFASLALISRSQRDSKNARRMARNALEAETRASPFARHRSLGVVKNIDPSIRKRIRQLAA